MSAGGLPHIVGPGFESQPPERNGPAGQIAIEVAVDFFEQARIAVSEYCNFHWGVLGVRYISGFLWRAVQNKPYWL